MQLLTTNSDITHNFATSFSLRYYERTRDYSSSKERFSQRKREKSVYLVFPWFIKVLFTSYSCVYNFAHSIFYAFIFIAFSFFNLLSALFFRFRFGHRALIFYLFTLRYRFYIKHRFKVRFHFCSIYRNMLLVWQSGLTDNAYLFQR